jgi:hypothetical protein
MLRWLLGLGASAAATVQEVIDPVSVAAQRPDIKAGARIWRDRLATARIGSKYDSSLAPTVSAPLTVDELDAFERELCIQFARALVYCPDAPLFTEKGMEVAMYISDAARLAGVHKFEYWGWCSRIRILPTEVAFERPPYRSYDFEVTWRAETPLA